MALIFADLSGRLGCQLELVQLLTVPLPGAGRAHARGITQIALLVLLPGFGQQVHHNRPPVDARVQRGRAKCRGADALAALIGQILVEAEQHHGVAILVYVVWLQEMVVLLLLLLLLIAAAFLFCLQDLSYQLVDPVRLGVDGS